VTEFTGERVIPGQVNDDLWAEHMARYAFAARLAHGRRVLDAGCGTGYGVNELAGSAAWIVGADIAREATDYAKAHVGNNTSRLQASFVQASVTALPFSNGAFDLVTAFEVIEHLAAWRELLSEARRVLAPGGLFLVSTPNRLYYADSRRLDGPNPYHVHEFEFTEFGTALREFFPHVSIRFQNRVEAFTFHGYSQRPGVEVHVEAVTHEPANAHFFIGVCANEALPDLQTFVYVPRAANVLREREQHIRLLDQELEQSKQWLQRSIADHHKLQEAHEEQTRHLEAQNRWASDLEKLLKDAQARIVQLQEESAAVAAGYARKVAELEQENREKTAWAVDTETRLTADLAARAEHLASTVRLLDAAEATVVERTEWAQRLDTELAQLQAKLALIRQSRWVKLGRTIGLGPRVD
jgi:ubiquinone/menaquinone biosynthesis C-methylase UbiE